MWIQLYLHFYVYFFGVLVQLANYLKDIGIKKGDAVIIYLPMLMELPIAMLACARIGAVHSVLLCIASTPFSFNLTLSSLSIYLLLN